MIDQLKTVRRKIESARIELQRLCREEERLRDQIAIAACPFKPGQPVEYHGVKYIVSRVCGDKFAKPRVFAKREGRATTTELYEYLNI